MNTERWLRKICWAILAVNLGGFFIALGSDGLLVVAITVALALGLWAIVVLVVTGSD